MVRSMILTLVAGMGFLFATSTAEAGRIRGAGSDVATVAAYGSVSYDEDFYANERASVVIVGNGLTLLRVTVFDEDGNYITSDTGYSCSVAWYPRWAGEFTIRVTNLGSFRNTYAMQSN